MALTDWTFKLASYTGVLQFPAVSDVYSGVNYGVVSIPLFIKEHPIAVRKPKMSEINTVATLDPVSQLNVETQMAFFGSRDPLELALSGWLVTPFSGTAFTPTYDGTKTGTVIPGLTGVSYAELISAYIEGRMSRTWTGGWRRTDPVSYVDPWGRVYYSPVISSWECTYTQPAKKQTFSMTLYIETGGLNDVG